MSEPESPHDMQGRTTIIRISPNEHGRESALRRRFAHFWETASGDPRAVYDTFIAASPLIETVVLEAVDEDGVRGWWVRPTHTRPNQAILFLHGGGYVKGSAHAYRGFVSQLVSRAQVP